MQVEERLSLALVNSFHISNPRLSLLTSYVQDMHMQMHRGANLIWKLFSGQFSYTTAVIVVTHMEFHVFKLLKKWTAISPQNSCILQVF